MNGTWHNARFATRTFFSLLVHDTQLRLSNCETGAPETLLGDKRKDGASPQTPLGSAQTRKGSALDPQGTARHHQSSALTAHEVSCAFFLSYCSAAICTLTRL